MIFRENRLSHLHNTADKDCCSGETQACPENRLNTIKSEISRIFQPWLLYRADAFHLCLLYSPTFWSLHLWSCFGARLPPPSLYFTLSIDTLPLSLCFTAGGGGGWLNLPLAPAITQNLLSLVPFHFFQMCNVLTAVSLMHSQSSGSLFFLLIWLSVVTHVALLFSSRQTLQREGSPYNQLSLYFAIFPFMSTFQVSCKYYLNTWTLMQKFKAQKSRVSPDL